MKPDKMTFSRWIKAVLMLALLALVAGGAWFYRVQEQLMRHEAEENLSAIARLKADQIAAWRNDRMVDAAVLQENMFLLQSVMRYVIDPSADHAAELRARFRILAKQHDYTDILLVDPDGKLLLSLSGDTHLHSGYKSALPAALRERTPVFVDLHTEGTRPDASYLRGRAAFRRHGTRPKAARRAYPGQRCLPVPLSPDSVLAHAQQDRGDPAGSA